MNEQRSRIWETIDVESRITGWEGNPFDVQGFADFTSVSGSELRLPLFYAGNSRWIARFMPTETGTWSYRIHLGDSGVSIEGAGAAGTVIVEDASPEAKGRLRRADANPRRLEWENGDECFLLGFECDWLATLDLDVRTGAKARTLIKSVKENGFNHVVMNVYAHEVPWGGVLGRNSRYDFSTPKSWPFGGDNDHPDYDTLNIAYFDNLDNVVVALREAGIVCHLMIYVWNKAVNWPEQNSPADNQFFEYVIARYQGYSNIMWDVSKEALTYGYCSPQYIAGKCRRVRELDAYNHLLTVHDREFCEQYPELVDVISVQDWGTELYSRMTSLYEQYPDKPVVNIEHGGYEESPFLMAPGDYQDPVACLERNYLCVFAGVYSTYYWQGCSWNIVCYEPEVLPAEKRPRFEYYRHLQELFSTNNFGTLTPLTGGRVSSSGHAMQAADGSLLILKPKESYRIHLRIPKEISSIQVSWFNPLTGETVPPVVFAAEGFLAIRAPWEGSISVARVELRPSAVLSPAQD